jgi:hypothetical protein
MMIRNIRLARPRERVLSLPKPLNVVILLQESRIPSRIAPLGDPVRIKQALIELQAEPRHDPESNGLPAGVVFTRECITGDLARILDCCARRQPIITLTTPVKERGAGAVPTAPCPLG